MRENLVRDCSGLDHAWPADEVRDAEAAFPAGVLFATEHGRTAIGPGKRLGSVVGGVDHDRIVGDAELFEFIEQLAHMTIVLDHTVCVDAETRLAFGFLS